MALKEVCVAARDFGPGRAQAGDIIAIREPMAGIGKKEGVDFLWLLMDEEDLPQYEFSKLDPERPCLPLEELKAQCPELDLEKCKCPNTFYQPFFDTCPKTFKHRDLRERPVRVKYRERKNENGKQPPQRGK